MYIALRAMQVQGDDGNTRQVKPGDNIPEAEGWKTREAYVRRGWICLEGQPLNDGATARMVRAIRDRDKALNEAGEFIEEQNQEIRDRGDKISQLSSELEEVRGEKATAQTTPDGEIYNVAAEARDAATLPSDTARHHHWMPDDDPAPSDASPVHESGADLADSEAPPAPVSQDDDPKLTKKELQKMAKDSLMTLADSMGVDPGQSKNKLVEAIFAAQ